MPLTKHFATLLLTLLLLPAALLKAQSLRPGFDPEEYLTMLSIASRQSDSAKRDRTPPPAGFTRAYRSPVVGLDNRWDLWTREDGQLGVISIRGTVATTASWLANFYSAMAPATGSLQLNDSTAFPYQLAAHKNAAVHTGWLIALAHIAPDIEAKIRECYARGMREFNIIGHSQGGTIAFLLRSYLHYQVQKGQLPADLSFKTYCSAAPKPGNQQYVYDYNFITRNGWSFTVLNTEDWVPETPVGIQQLTDMNELNPFNNLSTVLGKQNFFVRMYAKGMFNKMRISTRKAERRYEKYLGDRVYKLVKKKLPQLREPNYVPSMAYLPAGVPIVLKPDTAYMERFHNKNPYGIWYHHTFEAYYSLTETWYGTRDRVEVPARK